MPNQRYRGGASRKDRGRRRFGDILGLSYVAALGAVRVCRPLPTDPARQAPGVVKVWTGAVERGIAMQPPNVVRLARGVLVLVLDAGNLHTEEEAATGQDG